MKPLFRSCSLLFLGLCIVVLFIRRAEVLAFAATLMQARPLLHSAFLFLGIFTVGSALALPNSMFMLLGGAFFGLWWGMALNLLGFGAGCAIAFLVSRHLAGDFVLRRLPERTRSLLRTLGYQGWKLVAVLRLVPVIPAFSINYALGLTPVRFRDYLWASVVFTLPNGFILTYAGVAGESLLEGGGLDAKAPAALALLAASLVLGNHFRKKLLAGTAPEAAPDEQERSRA